MVEKIGPTPATAGPEKQENSAILNRTPKFKKLFIIRHESRVSEIIHKGKYGKITSIPARNIFSHRYDPDDMDCSWHAVYRANRVEVV